MVPPPLPLPAAAFELACQIKTCFVELWLPSVWGQAATARKIAGLAGTNYDTTRRHLRALSHENLVVQTGAGWQITPGGRAFVRLPPGVAADGWKW